MPGPDRRGVVLMIAYVQRYHPLTVRMGELIKAKTYGDTFGDTFHVSLWTEQFTKVGRADSWHHRADTLGGGQLFRARAVENTPTAKWPTFSTASKPARVH